MKLIFSMNKKNLLLKILFVLIAICLAFSASALEYRQFDELFDRRADFVGKSQCIRCHFEIVRSFSNSKHKKAFISLASRGKDDDKKCIPCHTTGYGKRGGFRSLEETPELIGVQCESCHGPASLHIEKIEIGEFKLSMCTSCHQLGKVEGMAADCDRCHPLYKRHLEKIKRKQLIIRKPNEETCKDCHNADNDPDFDLKSMYSLVGHGRVTADFSKLESKVEKEKNVVFLEEKPEVKKGTAYVGNDKCIKCHQKAYKKWLSTKHSESYETLEDEKEEKTTRCIRCHTTGYGRRSGFIDAENTPYLREVGCETCHGPGKDHIKAPKNKKMDTIYGITSDCPTCGISVTCKRCHNMRQDPDFDTQRDVEIIRCDKE